MNKQTKVMITLANMTIEELTAVLDITPRDIIERFEDKVNVLLTHTVSS